MNTTLTRLLFHFVLLLCLAADRTWSESTPLRFGIVGLTHDHARGFIPGAISRNDIQLAGIAEPDQELAKRYAKQYKLNDSLFYPSLEKMLQATNVQAVATFTSTFEHYPRYRQCCCATGGT